MSDLASELRLSRATIRARLDRLTSTGEIVGFTVIVRSDVDDLSVRGIMMVEVGGRASDGVVRALSGFTEVTRIHTTNGKWDLVVELGTRDLRSLDAVLRQIRLVPGINATETSLLLATPRDVRSGADVRSDADVRSGA